MKTTIITAVLGLSALSMSSCSYLGCITADNPQECAAGKAIESAISYLADAKSIDSQEKAESFASKWSKVQSAISTAQSLGVDVPESAKKAYNDTLARIVKHNYFGSSTLKTAMQNAQYIQ